MARRHSLRRGVTEVPSLIDMKNDQVAESCGYFAEAEIWDPKVRLFHHK